MFTTKLLGVVGLLLTLSSIVHARFWGYERSVLLMQAGGLALALGLFFRITGRGSRTESVSEVLSRLYDMERLTGRL